jgi:hypothetical protein
MALARPGTLAVAAAIASPALWHAFVRQDLPPSTALLRFLIAVPVSAAMLALLRALTASYRQPEPPIRAVAERLDTARADARADARPDGRPEIDPASPDVRGE